MRGTPRRRPVGLPRQLFPAITAGLRCGVPNTSDNWLGFWALPGHHGRAPLRALNPAHASHRARTSSRPSRPGSVAGGPAPASPTPRRCSSRPSRPGSVAGFTSAIGTMELLSALPGHHGRAPLREVHPAAGTRRAAALPGHHGRAPLRAVGAREVQHARVPSSRPSRPGSVAGR